MQDAGYILSILNVEVSEDSRSEIHAFGNSTCKKAHKMGLVLPLFHCFLQEHLPIKKRWGFRMFIEYQVLDQMGVTLGLLRN